MSELAVDINTVFIIFCEKRFRIMTPFEQRNERKEAYIISTISDFYINTCILFLLNKRWFI